MGLEISTEEVAAPSIEQRLGGWFGAYRHLGVWPTLYPSIKTAVTVDVLEAGLILAFVLLAFCFYLVLPGIRGSERWQCFIRITLSLFLGASVLLCNYGQEWEVDEIETVTQYKAGTAEFVKAKIGIKIGLRNVNITLKGDPINQINETINYNERFWWSYPWSQGAVGFGPESARINQEFREAQHRGLPYPILWVAEYFTFDGEGARWGRNYKTAGWYAHIMLWSAFPMWILANILFFMNPRFGGYMLALMGLFMLTGSILWGSIRNFNDLRVPFEGPAVLEPRFGWCFWLNIFAGCLSLVLAALILLLDIFIPDQLATFFGVGVLKDYEEYYPDSEMKKSASSSAILSASGQENPMDPLINSSAAAAVPHFRKRGFSLVRHQRKPEVPPRLTVKSSTGKDDDNQPYQNAQVSFRNDAVDIESVHFRQKL